MRNPIITAMMITFITLVIVYIQHDNNMAKLFVMCTLANVCYLFFHTCAINKYVESRQSSASLATEYSGIRNVLVSHDPVFVSN
jgi:hypothetical protein